MATLAESLSVRNNLGAGIRERIKTLKPNALSPPPGKYQDNEPGLLSLQEGAGTWRAQAEFRSLLPPY